MRRPKFRPAQSRAVPLGRERRYETVQSDELRVRGEYEAGRLIELYRPPSPTLAPQVRPSSKGSSFHETAENVRAGIRRPVSRQHICLDRRSEARSAAVWTARFCVDR